MAEGSKEHGQKKFNKNKRRQKNKTDKQKTQIFNDVDEPDQDDSPIDNDFVQLLSCDLNLDKITSKVEQGEVIIICKPPFKCNIDETCNEVLQVSRLKCVKMPFCDTSNWDLIKSELGKTFTSGTEVEDSIKRLNNLDELEFDFQVLREFINFTKFIGVLDIVNDIARLALELPRLLQNPLPLLRKTVSKTLILSRRQVACLLANAFFCTFPQRSEEYQGYPLFNFASVFSSKNNKSHIKIKSEKLKCLFNYFKHILNEDNQDGIISFERRYQSSDDSVEWSKSEKVLSKVNVQNSGRMEISGKDFSVVDFANRYMGGGVMNMGCVQEEIMFLICPELLVSRLFMQSLNDNEAIIITGHSMFNSISGYSNTFQWIGDYQDSIGSDTLGRKFKQSIAMDAINFRKYKENSQFEQKFIDRELNKSYIGFYGSDEHAHNAAIATGKWGCGAYKGDPSLKFLIQLLAASEAERQLIFYTFRDKELANNIKRFNQAISDKQLIVKQMYQFICEFKKTKYKNILDYIIDKV